LRVANIANSQCRAPKQPRRPIGRQRASNARLGAHQTHDLVAVLQQGGDGRPADGAGGTEYEHAQGHGIA
jgi:hypothetical protein